MAINLLGLRSHEVMMVAAHQEDLRAAQGMQVAFVARPMEQGPSLIPDLALIGHLRSWRRFHDLAQQLGAG
jgi:2-haloacid dehalogenase